jgi:hypothetical protein
MSPIPKPSGRFELKNTVLRSEDTDGNVSLNPPLTAGPRLKGSDHGSLTVSRVEAHRSLLPSVPALFEDEHFKTVMPDVRGNVPRWPAKFVDQHGSAK